MRRDGKAWAHPLFILNVSRNRARHTRVGFVVSKQLGKAHDRNRAKRRASEAFRLLRQQVTPGWDVVFVVRKAVISAPFPDLQLAIVELLRRARLWVAVEDHVHATPERPGDNSPLPAVFPPDPS